MHVLQDAWRIRRQAIWLFLLVWGLNKEEGESSTLKMILIYFYDKSYWYIFSQREWRRHQAQEAYKQHKKATLALQCLWRAKVARKELKKLKMVSFITKRVLRMITLIKINLLSTRQAMEIKIRKMLQSKLLTIKSFQQRLQEKLGRSRKPKTS